MLKTSAATVTLFFLLICFGSQAQGDAQAYFDAGVKNIKGKEYVKAIGDFTNALSIRVSYADAYFQRAKAKTLLGEEMGFVNSEACSDYVQAMRYGHKEASTLLRNQCMNECFDTRTAFLEPEMVYCADFGSKVLTEIPVNTPLLTNLVRLSLFNNKFTKYPESISNLYTLVSLDLSANKLTEIPASISKLTNLKEVNLSKNFLVDLPYEFGNLQDLTFLNLRSNMLVEIPKSISRLKALETLDLSLNKLTGVPMELTLLKNLKTLNLVGNDIPKNKQEIISKLLPNTKIYFE